MSFIKDVSQRFYLMFGMDLRSLALFRVGISIIILLDLYVRSQHLSEFYTNSGVLPIPAAIYIQNSTSSSFWSLHLMNGSEFFISFLFLCSAIFAFFMLIGWKTKLFTFLSWIMLTSLHNRFELNLNGGDLLLRVALFWALFLPIEKLFSIDSIHESTQIHHKSLLSKNYRVLSLACIAWLIQFASMYVFSFGLKSGNTWWEGTAVSAALQHEQFLTRFGFFLRSILFPPQFFSDPSIRWNLL